MKTIEAYIKNVNQQLLMYYKDQQRGNIADKHQAHIAAQLINDTSDFIMNTSSDQIVPIQTNIMSVISKLTNSNARPEHTSFWSGSKIILPALLHQSQCR